MNAIDIDDNDYLNFAKIAKNFVQKKYMKNLFEQLL